jgi:hypothetical protein
MTVKDQVTLYCRFEIAACFLVGNPERISGNCLTEKIYRNNEVLYFLRIWIFKYLFRSPEDISIRFLMKKLREILTFYLREIPS